MLCVATPIASADVHGCGCDTAKPETMTHRECSLCVAADAQPPKPDFFAIRDASPNKPNRWLALPRSHRAQPEELAGMKPDQRTAYWSAAIAKARELWGEAWGLAVNSLELRTQCHMHIHIGRLRSGVEDPNFVLVKTPDQIPLPREEDGMWVHPAEDGLHVHWGNPMPEFLLER